jgi:hypothetical protein
MGRAFIARRARRYFCASRRDSASFAICVAGAAGLIAYSAAGRSADKVTVKLTGEIAPECSILGADGSDGSRKALDLGDVTQPGQADYLFVVNCNAPFDYQLEARNGALLLTDSTSNVPGFTNRVPYQVSINIPTDGIAIDDRCTGDTILAGQVRCQLKNSGAGIALKSKSRMTLAWSPGEAVAMVGKYQENITLTIGIRY